MAVKVLSKTMDSTKLSSEKSEFFSSVPFALYFIKLTFLPHVVEFATVGKTKDGKIYHHLWTADEIDSLLREQGLAKVDDEPEAGDIK